MSDAYAVTGRGLVVSATTRVLHKATCPYATWIRHGTVIKLSCIPASERRFLKPCGNCKP